MRRRHFLLCLFGALPARAAPRRSNGVPDALAGLLADPAAARELGKAYLSTAPDTATVDMQALLRELSNPRTRATPLARHLARRVQDDFEHGNTALVGGWLLARTEAAVCAMLALR